jgi:hypothetical protein
MNRPTFFVVGAPKCGTTAVNEYFRAHPGLFVPDRQKDLAYFGADLHRSRPRESLEQYLSYYAPASADQRAGEVCVWYLYSAAATHELKEFCPDAPIFIMLRNPVDLAYSQHSQLVYSHDEDIRDFGEALDAEPQRARGERIAHATGNRPAEGLLYTWLGRYSEHVARYIEVFGQENVHVIVYDDFRADTPGVMRGVFTTLGVDPEPGIEFEIVNGNKVPRSDAAQRWLRTPPPRLEAAFRRLTPSSLHGRVVPYLVQLNTRYQARAALDPKLRVRLENALREDVERLSDILDRDLTGWCDAGRRPAAA